MRFLFTVQRYHDEIVGGSEAATKQLAERLVADGHRVDVVTSCSIDHRTWSNELDRGLTELNGVRVHRLPTHYERTARNFERLNQRMISPSGAMPWEQTLWSRRLGPNLDGFELWIDQHAAEYDLAISMTYMYPTSSIGLPLLSRRVPTIMFPTAHDESAYRMPLFRSLALLASGIACLTPEEEDLVHRVSKPRCPISTVGLGFDSPQTVNDQILPNALRGNRYLVAVGRVDFGKGTSDLIDLFRNYKKRFPSDLKLALVGESAFEEDDVIPLGFCSEQEKQAVIKHSEALVHPSFLESFSIVLCEAWLQGRPVLVNSLCDVTLGQVQRSGGGLGFASQLEFDQSVNSLLTDESLAIHLGQKGRRYVTETYDWAQVMSRFHYLSTKAIQYFEQPLVRHAITQ